MTSWIEEHPGVHRASPDGLARAGAEATRAVHKDGTVVRTESDEGRTCTVVTLPSGASLVARSLNSGATRTTIYAEDGTVLETTSDKSERVATTTVVRHVDGHTDIVGAASVPTSIGKQRAQTQAPALNQSSMIMGAAPTAVSRSLPDSGGSKGGAQESTVDKDRVVESAAPGVHIFSCAAASWDNYAARLQRGIPDPLVVDVRVSLRSANPHHDVSLRPLSGRDARVVAYIRREGGPIFDRIVADCTNTIRSGRSVAILCVGGKHRSVAVAEAVAKQCRIQAIHVSLEAGTRGGVA